MSPPQLGVLEWFHVGDRAHVERALAAVKGLGLGHLRTGLSWADWHTDEGREWYDWLVPHLTQHVDVVPCLTYTPPSLGIVPRVSSPPRNPKDYADFVDTVVRRYDDHFEWVELWNEPNNVAEWDWTLDPGWARFVEMIGGGAYWARQLGKRTVLGGMSPIDPNWLEIMFQHGAAQRFDAIGLHAFPGTWDTAWHGWGFELERVQEVIARHSSTARLWITETGFSTWRHDVAGQVRGLLDALDQPVDRVYWYAIEDLDPDRAAVTGFHQDEREYHFGIHREGGRPKLLGRLLAHGGVERVREAEWLTHPVRLKGDERPVVITGGAGFVGTNLAHRLLDQGRPVVVLDDLSRHGTYRNARWLREVHGHDARLIVGDVRDTFTVRKAVDRASAVFHLAAQVAVTTSLEHPIDDFEVNARGTLNVLAALRRARDPPPIVFSSTNKVYGDLAELALAPSKDRHTPLDATVRRHGISEHAPLRPSTPYGCSKACAEQYLVDHAKVYGIPAVVLRMSCIYGPHQHGNEDQGWVAHFVKRAVSDEPVTVYGDGRQVRDLLDVDDLVDAMLLAAERAPELTGRAFNIGGGPERTLSVRELLAWIQAANGRLPEVREAPMRPADQRYYVSDTRAFEEATGWRPRRTVEEGLARLHKWLSDPARAAEGGLP